MFAAHHRLDNLNLMVDNNSIAMLGFTDEIVSHGSLSEKFKSFGWETTEINGHDIKVVQDTLSRNKAIRNKKPKVVIAKTLKGRGVPGLENQPLSHIINPRIEALDAILGAESE